MKKIRKKRDAEKVKEKERKKSNRMREEKASRKQVEIRANENSMGRGDRKDGRERKGDGKEMERR